ncbi:MAG: hypothetical protein DRQ55_01450 [Planctomycetota bacterium]|nr:MAG: hypothetical protein DRQ55_01450 [Planctomycetota bacterium]
MQITVRHPLRGSRMVRFLTGAVKCTALDGAALRGLALHLVCRYADPVVTSAPHEQRRRASSPSGLAGRL